MRLLPIILGQEVIFRCPLCNKTEAYCIREEDIKEIMSTGASKLGFFHGDHILLCSIDKTGKPIVHETKEAATRSLYSERRIYMRGFLIKNKKCCMDNINIAFVDIENKVVDIRCYSSSPVLFLTFFSAYYDTLIKKHVPTTFKIAIVHQKFDMIKYKNLCAFIMVQKREYTQKDLSKISAIIESSIDEISKKLEIPEDIKEIYDVFVRYSWYSILLKYPILKLSDKTLRHVSKFLIELKDTIPSHENIQVLGMIMKSQETIIKTKKSIDALKMLKPMARLHGEEVVQALDTIITQTHKGREITLDSLIEIIKSDKIYELVTFLKRLKEKGYIQLEHK